MRLSDEVLPEGWELYNQPFGVPYFFNRSWKLVTTSDVTNGSILESLARNYEGLVADYKCYMEMLDDYDLSLEIYLDDPERAVYHVMDHKHRKVLEFPKSYKDKWDIQEDRTYWDCFLASPMHHPLPQGAEEDMLSGLIYFTAELIMGNGKTTTPFTLTQCLEFISLYQTLKEETNEATDSAGVRRWFVSYTMSDILVARYKYHYGEVGAATTIQPITVAAPGWKQRVLNICLLFLCFGTYRRYRERFMRTHTNGGLHITTFRVSLTGTLQEWSDSNLLGTVFTLANMTFLAVPNLPKIQQILALVSTCFSLASFVVGMYLVWQHRPKTQAGFDQTWCYLNHATGDPSSITFTSVFLCVPLVLLLWSIVIFAVAILHFSFKNYKGVSLGFLAFVASVAIFTTLCIHVFFYRGWKTSSGISLISRVRKMLGGRGGRTDLEMDAVRRSDMEAHDGLRH